MDVVFDLSRRVDPANPRIWPSHPTQRRMRSDGWKPPSSCMDRPQSKSPTWKPPLPGSAVRPASAKGREIVTETQGLQADRSPPHHWPRCHGSPRDATGRRRGSRSLPCRDRNGEHVPHVLMAVD
jgi:hypothetical protein